MKNFEAMEIENEEMTKKMTVFTQQQESMQSELNQLYDLVDTKD